MLRVTPLYGSHFDGKGASNTPRCSLVEYGGVTVLWNVGWGNADEFPADLPDHQALIISDSTLGSIGGLPLYCKQQKQKRQNQQGNHPPIYTTFPTVKMGQMTLYDYHASLCLDGKEPPFTLDEMDSAFASLQTVKYSQAMMVSDPITGQPALSITAQRAGHVVGGAFFVLQRLQDETIVVLTSTYHVAKEIHLDSSTLLKYGATPDVLVTYPGGPAMGQLSRLYGSTKPLIQSPVVTQAEKMLVEVVLAVLRRDGHVLLPVDASGRVLELLLLLSQYWDRHRLTGVYNLCWLGPMSKNTIDFARSQLEWMAGPLGAQFDSQRGHPFAMKNVSICCSHAELERAMANGNPSCVLASGASLDCGPARDLMLKWAENQDHAIIFTDSSRCFLRSAREPSAGGPTSLLSATSTLEQAEGADEGAMVGSAMARSEISEYSTAAQLLSHWCQAKVEGREMEDVVEVDVLVPRRAPLAGAELKAFLAEEESTRQAQKAAEERQAMLREVELAKGQLRLGEDTAGGEEARKTSVQPKKTIAKTTHRPRKKSRFDSSLFLKFSKPQHLIFEFREEAVGIGQPDSVAKYGIGESVGRSGEVLEDDYGIAVIAERFTDIVTGVDPSKFAGGSGRVGDEVLRRGFGFGVDGRPVVASASGGGPAAQGRTSQATDGEAAGPDEAVLDEQALEAEDLSEGRGIIRGRNGRPPTKVSTVVRKLEVLAEINYVPLEGRVDARAARQSVRAVQPREVIVLGGPSNGNDTRAVDEVGLLAEAVQAHTAGGKRALTPTDGETAELNVGHAAYSVRLIDTPYVNRSQLDADDSTPEPIELHEMQLGECTVSRLNFVATGRKVAADGSIVLAPRLDAVDQSRDQSIYISDGEVLLTDLRAEIIAQGMKAEYSAHAGYSQLIVNSKIVVRKDQESGKIDVEGPLCQDFYSVRRVVCGQFISL